MSSSSRPHWGEQLVRQRIAEGRLPADALDRLRPGGAITLGTAPGPVAAPPSSIGPPGGRRSKTEERYEQRLLAMGLRPLYEPIRLRISLPTGQHHYKSDFFVVIDGAPELHEVKGGFPRERDWMRFEMAVAQWGCVFTFIWAQWKKGEWTIRRFPRRAGET
jgi:hypothetical protein